MCIAYQGGDAQKYLDFLKNGSNPTLTQAEINGIFKVDMFTSMTELTKYKNNIINQKIEVYPFNNMDRYTASTKQKCNYGEYKAARNKINNLLLKRKGYNLKSIGRPYPKTPDDKIQKGIDGIYRNLDPNSNVKFVIDEAKYNTATLSTLKDGEIRQMSDSWLLNSTGTGKKGNRIEQSVNNKRLAKEI